MHAGKSSVEVSSSGDERMNDDTDDEESSVSDALYDGLGGTMTDAVAADSSLSALRMMTTKV